MILGFGGDNRGPSRVAKMLSTPNAAATLVRIADASRTGDPVDAYREAARAESKLASLGPSFWTKFMCFCSLTTVDAPGLTPDSAVAPILDQRMSAWIWNETAEHIPAWASTKQYGRYVELLSDWGDQLELRVDRVEELIFQACTPNGRLNRRAGWNEHDVYAHRAIEQMRSRLEGRDGDERALDGLDAIERILFDRNSSN